MQNGSRIHPTPISNDPRARRKIRLCAVPAFVDAEDQVGQASASVERKLSRHVVGCPEAHDLEEPLTAGIGAMPEGKIGKDQRATGGDRLRLATGLRRPTKDEAFARAARKDDDLEDKLFEQYQQELRERGVAEADIRELAEQRVYRTLRGSEAPAHAALRMTDRRYVKQLEELNTNLAAPIDSEPLSYALTRLSQEIDKDDATVRQYAIDAKVVFLGDPVEPVAPDHPSTGGPQSRQIQAIESGQWGVVPVFPWTTHPGRQGAREVDQEQDSHTTPGQSASDGSAGPIHGIGTI